MASALELSVKFGVDRKKIQQIFDYVGIELDEGELDVDAEFEKVARSVRRNRVSAGTLAWIYKYASDDQRNFLFEMDAKLLEEFESLGMIGKDEILRNAEVRIEAAMTDEASQTDWASLAVWVKKTITDAQKPVRHNYLAVRVLLSLPAAIMQERARGVATVFNKLRHRGFLAGWFETIEEEGGNVIVYNVPGADKPAKLDIPAGLIERAKEMYDGDLSKMAGFIGYQIKMKYEPVLKFLQDLKNPVDKFDL